MLIYGDNITTQFLVGIDLNTNNSPRKVLSRLIHSDYFDTICEYQMEEWQSLIDEHKLKCRHPNCRK